MNSPILQSTELEFPTRVHNWIGGGDTKPAAASFFVKRNPATGETLCEVARSQPVDVQAAVQAAVSAQPGWAAMTAVARGNLLFEISSRLASSRALMARAVAIETGKSVAQAAGETDAAIALGRFMAGEGQRLFGRSIASGVAHRTVVTLRQPIGVAGLIVAANTPVANVAWKVFPALICGNAVVLKAAEDAPWTAWLFARLAKEAGLPDGVLNVVHGIGAEAGAALVRDPAVGVISFTGSTAAGKEIAAVGGQRLARVSLELGGKNPLVVCDDADIDRAVHWASLSSFSNAGQRCASSSRIIVQAKAYDEFREKFVAKTSALRLGTADTDDLGPVINQRQLDLILTAIAEAQQAGARVLTGGCRSTDPAHTGGYYLKPTILEGLAPDHPLSQKELFGPITNLYRAVDFADALRLANSSDYGLTSCIHTRDLNRALTFVERVQSGVTVLNAGTFGSEPHLPFGGFKASGNGSREPGTEALDVYSELKNVYLNHDPGAV